GIVGLVRFDTRELPTLGQSWTHHPQEAQMWTRVAVFVSACVWTGCTSAPSAAPSDDDGTTDPDADLQVAQAVLDPGPRGGAAGAGFAYDTLSADEKTFFTSARDIFAEVDSVSGKIEEGKGL